MAFGKGFLTMFKPKAAAAAAGEVTAMSRLKRMKDLGVPYASLEPKSNPSNFNVSGFLKGSKTPKKTI